MRAELSEAVGRLIDTIDTTTDHELRDDEQTRILAAANVVTLARTAVDFDYRGDVIDAHAPEAPTRFAKQLGQVVRGAVALGIDRATALRLAIRCARDSMPPIRLAILDDVATFPGTLTRDVRKRLEKPRATVDRQLQALHMLGVLSCDEEEAENLGRPVTLWRYSLAEGIDPDVLTPPAAVPDLLGYANLEREERENTGTNISGTVQAPEQPAVVRVAFDPWAGVPSPPGAREAALATDASPRRRRR
jgi:hypothetical protein